MNKEAMKEKMYKFARTTVLGAALISGCATEQNADQPKIEEEKPKLEIIDTPKNQIITFYFYASTLLHNNGLRRAAEACTIRDIKYFGNYHSEATVFCEPGTLDTSKLQQPKPDK